MLAELDDKICYTAERREVLALIPQSAQRILDVGCAHGLLGRSIKAAQPCEIVGIEVNEQATREAALYLDKVYCENIETFVPPYPPGYFDCMIMADVLEHLVNPWRVLSEYKPYLSSDGILLISVPNVRHYRVVGKLILGRWEYEESGILDNTHLRFFTLKSILELLASGGFEPVTIKGIRRARPLAKAINSICLNRLKGFLAQQYVVVARKQDAPTL